MLSEQHLPEVITAEIVVIGNRWQCAKDTIVERLFGECEVVEVCFRRE